MTNKNIKTLAWVVASIALVALVLVWWNWADYFASFVITIAHQSFFVVAPVVGIVTLAGLAWFAFGTGTMPHRPYETGYWASESEKSAYQADLAAYKVKAARAEKVRTVTRVTGFALVAAAVVAFGFSVNFWRTHGYNVDRQYVEAITIVDDADLPSFEERVPFDVADASGNNNMSDINGDRLDVRYVTDADSTWNALVERRTRAWNASYQVVQEQHLALTGPTSEPTFCEFDPAKADRRLGGWFSSSLERAIAHQARGAFYDAGDVYGICSGADGDHPLVVVPLQKMEGWLYAHAVPAGVAVYDGLTGEVSVRETVKAGELAGPVYPMSLAARTREATVSLGTWSERKNTGFDLSSWGGNASEFSMRTTDGDGVYFTALTPRGSSDAISAEAVISSDQVTAGQLNTLTVHKLADARVSHTTMEKNILADYGDLPNWRNDEFGIYEIAPVSDDEWVASLGVDQNILYRMRINADGTSCIDYANGTKQRCGKVTGVGDNGIGGALQQDGTSGIATSTTDLGSLTDEQLVELQATVTAEVLRRVSSGEVN